MLRKWLWTVFVLLGSIGMEGQGFTFAQEGFTKELISADLGFPSGITFDDLGRGYIWYKHGAVHRLINDVIETEPWIDLGYEVLDTGDHGLLGFALDPDFQNNGYVYLLYRVDHNYLFNHDSPDYDPEEQILGVSIGRLTRYTADTGNDLNSVDMDSRFVLLGEEMDNAIPQLHNSHGVGSLVFGNDGSLLVSCGDGSTWTSPYGGNGPPYYGAYVEQALDAGIIPIEQEVGSFRSQQPQSYSGNILRINPSNGEGYPSNPYFDSDQPNSAISKTWAFGFRNPFRCVLRPGTGSIDPTDG
jgi:glucose/arabinose dehydrogenase